MHSSLEKNISIGCLNELITSNSYRFYDEI